VLWIDDEGVEQRIAKIDDPQVRSGVSGLWEDGYAIVPNAFRPELCDRAIEDFRVFEAPFHA
jgi:hypothetical protein